MKKILFVKFGDFSFINENVYLQLEKHFTEYKIIELDLHPILKRNIILLLINLFYLIYEYFIDFLLLRKNILRPLNYFKKTPYLYKKFRKIINNHLHSNSYSFIIQTQSLFDPINDKNIPYFIYTDHTNLNNLNYHNIRTSEHIASKKYIRLEKQAYQNAALIFVMSLNIRDSLVNQYEIDPDRVRRIFVGSNTRIPQQINQDKYASRSILFVGKEWERKGGPLLVKAFEIVRRAIPDASLVILGCKPEIQIENCSVLGDVTLGEVSKYYNSAAIFCMPSIREPFGIVYIEAMFNRLGVITNAMGATSDFIINNENGYLLNNTVEEYADKLIEILNDPEKCRNFGTKSYQIAKDKYTWKNVGNLMYEYIGEKIG